MRRVFADTSAFFALGSVSDEAHGAAGRVWARLQERDLELVTTSYVLLETCALLQRRLGLTSVRSFREDIVPLVRVVWVGEELNERGLALLLSRGKEDFSLVDAVSITVCRDEGIREVFAFDRHFTEEGFSPVR